MGMIEIERVTKTFGKPGHETVALQDVSLNISAGEFVVFLGPSGCGKSTLLRMLAGLTDRDPGAGRLAIEGRPVTGRDPAVGMVFQSYTSFPWLTVEDNVGFGLELAKVHKATRRATTKAILDRVSLTNFAGFFPSQLSGGMQQRVAISRALAMDPKVLLMDEPFGALDAMTRVEMQSFVLDIWSQDRKTVVFVTHDIDEAILLADRIVVFSPHPGRIAEEIEVRIQRPRAVEDTEGPTFTRLRHHLRRAIFSSRIAA